MSRGLTDPWTDGPCGVTLNSGVVNWSFLDEPPVLRFKIGVVVISAAVEFFFITFNSIKSFVLDAMLSAIADAAAAADDVDGAVDLTLDFVLIAMVTVCYWYRLPVYAIN